MKKLLFRNESWEARFLLFVWESCPSNCFNCSNKDLKQKYFSYYDLKRNISFIGDKIDKNAECMLFYTDTVYHPDIFEFVVDPILSTFKIFTLQTHPRYTEEYWEIVEKIVSLNPRVLFHICNFYLNEYTFDDLKSYTKNIVNLSWNFDMDLYFDFGKYKDLLKEYMWIFPWMINPMYENWKIKSLKLEYKNIEVNLYFQWEQNILENKKYITNIYYKECISANSFSIVNDSYINIFEELAFQYNWDILFHRNTLCSKAIKRISSIDKTDMEIIKDFKRLKKDLSEYNDWNKMGYNCYKCISNKINYI